MEKLDPGGKEIKLPGGSTLSYNHERGWSNFVLRTSKMYFMSIKGPLSKGQVNKFIMKELQKKAKVSKRSPQYDEELNTALQDLLNWLQSLSD